MNLTARELFQQLEGADQPLVLDVRNAEEFAHWTVEGRRPPRLLNVPYFAFVEDEEAATAKVRTWLGSAPPDRVGPPRLVVVCAAGGSSAYVAEILRARGIAAANLEGGMVAWGKSVAFQALPDAAPARIWQVLRFGRGCLSYVVASGAGAVVVDPYRGIDDYREFLQRERLRLRGVFDTHLHADHVSGAAALARAEGVACHANPADFEGAAVSLEPIADGSRIQIGGLEILPVVALHTPGHTPGSTSLLVNGRFLLTGDTVFVHGVGRPDLGGRTGEWARELHRTLHDRLRQLADDVVVLPAHASGLHELAPDGTVSGRLGDARRAAAALGADEAAFVREAERTAGPAPPAYAKIRTLNLGLATATEEELTELELGKNECALARR